MVYKRKGSSRYQITVPTRKQGEYIHLSTGTRDEATAEAMAAMWTILGAQGKRQWDLIDAVLERRLKLSRLYDHYIGGTLEQLRKELDDVDLAPEVEKWRATVAQRHRGESIRKYPRWSEALFPLDEKGKVKPALRSVVADPVHISGVLEQLPGGNTNRRRHHEVFTAVFAYLKGKRLVAQNPMAEVGKALKKKREQPHLARLEDALRLVHSMPDARTRAMAALAEGGGLEWQALRAMRPIDVVNAEERIVFAHGSKNVYRDRQAVVDAEFWPAFHDYVKSSGVHPMALLFDMPEATWRGVWRRTCKALREKHVPIPAAYAPHKARHTYTIRHLQAGDDPTLIAENLGHSDVATMFRDYSQHRPKATDIRRAKRAQEAK